MTERLVDVLNPYGAVLHTFPVLVDDPQAASEQLCLEKALKLAAHARLVPEDELAGLSARMHVARGGPLAPYGDDRHVLEGTRQGLEKVLRERAYLLWRQEECPDGRAEYHWQQALHRHLSERAYFLWLNEGCPEGRADEHWCRSVEYETYPA